MMPILARSTLELQQYLLYGKASTSDRPLSLTHCLPRTEPPLARALTSHMDTSPHLRREAILAK